MNPAKLKVVELRAELSARGLDTKGNKAVLVERLQEALDQEEGEEGEKEEDCPEEEQSNQESAEPVEKEPAGEPEVEALLAPPPEAPSEPQPSPEAEKEAEQIAEEKEEPSRSEPPEPEQRNPSPEKVPAPRDSPPKAPTPQKTPDYDAEQMDAEPSKSEQYDPADTEGLDDDEEKVETEEKMDADVKEEKEDTDYAKHLNQAENGHKEGFEDDIKPDIKVEGDVKTESDDSHVKTERDRDYESRDRKRRRSSSPRGRSDRKFSEWEPEIKDDAITLSWYDSDLNLTIEGKSFLEASPFSDGGFGYVWAGVRATHGFTSGSICYQVKIVSYSDVSHLEDEPNPNVIRVGWSAFSSSLQLGEEPFSYGYGGTGKFSVDCKFTNYGKAFGLNDVITCYLQFTDDEAVLSYGVNDEYLGVAQRVPLKSLGDRALAPHVLTKNTGFKVNFGQENPPWCEVQEDFEFVANYPVEKAVPGPKRPEKRSDCEMIMMCGLPACGKTVWATKHAAEHPEKNYNILGTNALIDRMKVMGLPRKANYSGRWDVLIEKCTKCLQRLMDIGCHRRRNYILDQTNVFPAAQRRKMRNFEGFTRKAVVIVPTDEEFNSRTEKQANDEQKDVPETAVLEMKANFTLPDKNLFDEVTYVELQEEEAEALIQKYAKEAAEKGHFRKSGPGGGPPAKRFRGGDFHHQKNDFRRDRFSSGPPGSPFRRGSDRGGPRGGGGWGGPRGGNGSGDRWRDRQGGGYGRQQQGDRSGWRGPQTGPPGGNGRGPRDYDRGPPRSSGYDRNSRSGPPPRQGGGGYGGNRDYRDNRGPGGGMKSGGMGGKPRLGDKPGQGNGGQQGQWNNQYQTQQGQAPAAGNQQAWGQQAQWGQQQAQAWSNYQQQWKGYQQGYNQQGYGQGYTPQQYNNWQQLYGNYQQQGWGQNSDGTFNYPQSWQNWYAAQSAGQSNAAQQPPQAK